MCIAISAKRGLRWQPLAAIGGSRPTFPAPWRGEVAHADFRDRTAFYDSTPLRETLEGLDPRFPAAAPGLDGLVVE